MNILIIGATGLVGQNLIYLLENSNYEIDNITFVASNKNLNNKIFFRNKEYLIVALHLINYNDFDFVFITTNKEISLKITPLLLKKNCIVIDNSSAFRNIDLTIPEINFVKNKKLYVNPNCCVIQSVIPLYFINKKYKINEIIYNTYQSLSGAGKDFYQKNTSFIGDFINENTDEEEKLINETRILLNTNINILANCIRVPVKVGHLVNIIIKVDCSYKNLLNILKKNTIYTNEFVNLENNFNIYTMRLKKINNYYSFYTYANNLLRGASYNSFQTLNYILE